MFLNLHTFSLLLCMYLSYIYSIWTIGYKISAFLKFHFVPCEIIFAFWQFWIFFLFFDKVFHLSKYYCHIPLALYKSGFDFVSVSGILTIFPMVHTCHWYLSYMMILYLYLWLCQILKDSEIEKICMFRKNLFFMRRTTRGVGAL